MKATFFFQVGNLCLKGGDPPLAASQLKKPLPSQTVPMVWRVQQRCRAHQLDASSYYSEVEWQWLERQQQFWAGGILGKCRLDHVGMSRDLSGKKMDTGMAVLRSNLNGMPMAQMLLSMDATVTTCHSKTANVEQHLRNADIVAWWDEMRSLAQPCANEKQTQVVVAIGQAEFVRWVHSSWVSSTFKTSTTPLRWIMAKARLCSHRCWHQFRVLDWDFADRIMRTTRLMVFRVSQVEIYECRGEVATWRCLLKCTRMLLYLLVCLLYLSLQMMSCSVVGDAVLWPWCAA